MTMTEPTFWDLPVDGAASRASDPPTSKAAAHQLDIRTRQAEVLRALRLRGVSSTAEEVRDTLAGRGWRRERNEVASRLAELADPERWGGLALVRRVGVKQNYRGRKVGTWDLTAEGLRRAKELDD